VFISLRCFSDTLIHVAAWTRDLVAMRLHLAMASGSIPGIIKELA
jgi:hypothetical protein